MKAKTYQIRNIIFKIIIAILIFLFVSIILFIGNGAMEKGAINSKIKAFKNRAIFVSTHEMNECTINLYKVNANEDYEINEFSKVIDDDFVNNKKIGSKCDIFLTDRNPLGGYQGAFVRDFVGVFSDFIYLGHTNMVIDNGEKVIESVGLSDNDGVRIKENYWIDEMVSRSNKDSLIGCRIKGLNEEKKDIIIEEIKKKENLGYNYNIFFSKSNKYYCTDLITEVVKKVDINLNYDLFFKTGSDILVSDDIFIIFYLERVDTKKFDIYYLDME